MSENTIKTVKAVKSTEEKDYKQLYLDECEVTKAQAVKINELEQLCKSFAEKEKQSTMELQRAALEYNARINYMLDCVKHAKISMELCAVAKTDLTKGA